MVSIVTAGSRDAARKWRRVIVDVVKFSLRRNVFISYLQKESPVSGVQL